MELLNLECSLAWSKYWTHFNIRYFILLLKGDGKDIMGYVFLPLFWWERFSSKCWKTQYCMQGHPWLGVIESSDPTLWRCSLHQSVAQVLLSCNFFSPLLFFFKLLPVGHPSHLTMPQHVHQSLQLIVPVLIYCLQYWGVGNSQHFPSVAYHFVNRV